MRVLDVGRNAAIWRVEFSPDGTRLVTTNDAAPEVRDIATGEWIQLTNTYFWNGSHASFHPSGRWLIGTGFGKVGPLIHDFEKQNRWHEPLEYRVRVLRTAFTADGKTVIYTAKLSNDTSVLACRPWKANGTLGVDWSMPLDEAFDVNKSN